MQSCSLGTISPRDTLQNTTGPWRRVVVDGSGARFCIPRGLAHGKVQQSAWAGCTQAWQGTPFYGANTDHAGHRSGRKYGDFQRVEGVLLKPLPYPQSEQLIGVWHTAPGINIKN